MNWIFRELRYAARRLRQSPGFTAATLLTLAVGISANTIMFTIVNGVLLKPLRYPHAEQLVEVYARDAQGHRAYVSQSDLEDWRAMAHSFDGLASWVPQSVNMTGGEAPQRVVGLFVSSNFLPVLNVSPAMGRGFDPGEDGSLSSRDGTSAGRRVAILTDRLWRSSFGANRAMLGKSADFNGEPYTIIGILPPSFVFPSIDVDILLPAFKYPNYSRDRAQTSCAVLGRLRGGVSLEAAKAEMNVIAARLAAAYPASNNSRGALVTRFQDEVVSNLRPSVIAVTGAVAFVLLIGCANVAGLLLARMAGRRRELAVRKALGASRVKLLAHVASESLLLAGAGGALGLLLSIWSLPLVAALAEDFIPYGATISLDRTTLVMIAAVSLFSALAVAVAPASSCLHSEFLRAGRGSTSLATRDRRRSALVACEIALAMVLLVGAGLMLKSFSELQRVQPGFNTRNLVTLAYRVPRTRYPSGAQQTQFHREVTAKIQALPGVLGATAVRAVPLGGNAAYTEFLLTDRPEPGLARRPRALLNFADPDFFSTMQIPLRAGRTFNQHDQPDSTYVVVVNETLARRYFETRDPIGRQVRIPSLQRSAEIIGVVGDVKQNTLQDPAEPQMYGALAQNPFIFTSLAVRTSGDPLRMVDAIRRAIWQVDRNQPVWSVQTYEQILQAQAHLRRIVTGALTAYSSAALLLAAIGIFGLVSYSVRQRTAEIGLRIALGARPHDVVGLILRQGCAIAATGILSGSAGAMWLSRYLRSQLYAVSTLDTEVYAVVAALLLITTVGACLIPVRRAAQVDPAVTLRYE